MKKVYKNDLLEMIANLPGGDQKRAFIAQLIQNKELTEDDVAGLVVQDVEQNASLYAELIGSDPFLPFLWERFREHPTYLARALVRARPDLFYSYGFAFRLVLKLKADLGPVLIRPSRPTNEYSVSVFRRDLPDLVQQDLMELDFECRFRDTLFFMSRDVELGFEYITEAIARAETSYERDVQTRVRSHCEHLLSLQFPDFVSQFRGHVFPSFHVRWWLDKAKDIPRILNTGDTGTHKTAFATIATHHFGCRRTLVICPPHARPNWPREISGYYTDGKAQVTLVRNRQDMQQVRTDTAEYTVIGYSTLIEKDALTAIEGAKFPFDAVIWDECHYGAHATGSNPAQRATACTRLIQNLPLKRLIALSATPWENEVREFAPIASAMRPDVFPTPESFQAGRPEDPRFIRELFANQILEVGVHEVRDLPPITPKPWEDLFSSVLIDMKPEHREVYLKVRENTETILEPAQKVARLLLTATHPHKIQKDYEWDARTASLFSRWDLSSKLVWLHERLTLELAQGAKAVVAAGIHVEGLTRPGDDEDEIWVGGLLRKWFGDNSVLILDGSVSQAVDRTGSSERDRLIQRWRLEPGAKILLISMRACPDSVNLSVPALPGIKKLFVTALSYPWVPWKQFLGRFWRDGQGVPVFYAVPVLRGTIDEALLYLISRKWQSQQLFRAQVPLTKEEWQFLEGKMNLRQLAEAARSNVEKVNIIGGMVRGRGERDALRVLSDTYGMSTNGAVFAQAFLETQDTGTSGNIARFMRPVIQKFIEQGLVHAEGVLDAGCGLLTLERFLDLPVFAVDMNQHMIDLARPLSRHQGKNARVDLLSQLPKSWEKKFELTVASLVLDWTSLSKPPKGKVPERLAILGELVRVTNPYGRVWITATHQSMDENILDTWAKALTAQGYRVIEDLTGLVYATDQEKKNGRKFAFWSLCFTPNGRAFSVTDVSDFHYKFELERIKSKRGKQNEDDLPTSSPRPRVAHNAFEILERNGAVRDTVGAAVQAATHEVERLAGVSDLKGWRFHQTPTLDLDWRTLVTLHARGVLEIEIERLKRR